MTPLRTALLVNSLAFAGAERQMQTLAARLDPSRLDVTLVPLKTGGALEASVAAEGTRTWSPRSRGGLDVAAIRRLAAFYRRERIEVVLAANQYATLLSVLARRAGAGPIRTISAFHSSPEHIGADFRSRTMLRLYALALRGCAGLIYVSRLQREAWGERDFARGVPATVIQNGIDTSLFATPPADGRRASFGWTGDHLVVGLCAALRPEKRGEDLVEAAAIATAHGVPVRLLVVGDGPRRAAMEEACRARLAEGTYVFAGLQRDVRPFIHACDVMALVSDVEAFSMGVLEAMACGKPMVLTDVGGAREQIVSGVHGYVVPPRSPALVAERLETLWRDRSWPAMGAAARSRVVAEFSIARMVERYEQVLRFGAAHSHRESGEPG